MRRWPVQGLQLAMMTALLSWHSVLHAAGATAGQSENAPLAEIALQDLDASDIQNVYRPFVRHALTEAAKRDRGENLRNMVLARNVSLIDPRPLDCGTKPLAVIIDLDVAPGTPAEMDIERQSGFAALLDLLRGSDVRIAWLADSSERQLDPILTLLREGEKPVMRDADMMLFALPGSLRKQERRWQLAQSHCVVAIAGDRKGDFDELYDYLRDQSYAIRLEAFTNRGWFELPHPVAAIDSERLAISPEKKADE